MEVGHFGVGSVAGDLSAGLGALVGGQGYSTVLDPAEAALLEVDSHAVGDSRMVAGPGLVDRTAEEAAPSMLRGGIHNLDGL